MYYIYILRCIDNSLYTGITTDIDRRMSEHFTKDKKCAKYTYTHTANKLEIVWQAENKKLASKLEYHIKRLNKEQKENLIINNGLLKDIFKEKLNYKDYTIYRKNVENI